MTSRCRSLVAFCVLSTPAACIAQEALFPPMVFYPKSEFSNDMSDEHMTVHLRALKEPSLWKLSKKHATARAYRFLWLASFRHPICVRVVREGDAVWMRVSRHDGGPGMVAGKMNVERIEPLSLKQWERLDELVDKSKFWTAPAEVRRAAERAKADGVFVEGVQSGRFHVVERGADVMDWRLKDLCRLMLELAESKALPIWDRWRERERDDPNYHFEPPQIPDLYGAYPAETPK